MSKPAKASIWFAICSIIQRGISMITTPIFTRILSPEEYGTISVYNSWFAIIWIFATFELATGVFNKSMIKYEDDRDGYTSSTLFLATCITSVFFLVYLVAHDFWNNLFSLNTAFMVMMFVEIIFTEAMQFWSIRQRFDFEFKNVVIITLVANILGSALSVVLVIISPTHRAEFKIFGTLVVHIVVYGVIYFKLMQKGKKIYAPDYWKYAIGYNLPLIPHYLSQQILNQSDRIMIDRIIGRADAGLYTVAYQVAILMNLITNAVHASFSPWAFQSINNKEYKKIGDLTLKIIILMSAVCFLFSLFAPEVILILGGRTYSEAVWVVPPVAMSIVFNMLYSLIGNFAFFYEKTKFVMFGTMGAALANIILNAIFIPRFGYVAAGYTTLACYILYSLLHYFVMLKICRENGIEQPFNSKAIWSVAVVSVLLSIVSVFLYRYTLPRYLVIILIIGILIWKRKIIIRIWKLK